MLYAGPGYSEDGSTETATSEVFSLSDEEDGSRSLRDTSCYIPDYPFNTGAMIGFYFRGILYNCGEYKCIMYFETINLFIIDWTI